MKYADFKAALAKYPVFPSHLIAHLTDKPAVLRRQISEWIDKGYVIPLKRGMYTLRESDRAVKFSSYFLAGQLYTPSYISLETALSYYGLIPERVHAITSISTKKTQVFVNTLGKFTYRHVQSKWFGGFVAEKDEFGYTFFIATPERAVIDFLYFKSRELPAFNADIFEESFRLQHLELLNKRKLKKMAMDLGQQKLYQVVQLFISHIG